MKYYFCIIFLHYIFVVHMKKLTIFYSFKFKQFKIKQTRIIQEKRVAKNIITWCRAESRSSIFCSSLARSEREVSVAIFSLSLRLSLSVVMRRKSWIASSLSVSTRRRMAWAASEVFGDLGDFTSSLLTLWSSSLV